MSTIENSSGRRRNGGLFNQTAKRKNNGAIGNEVHGTERAGGSVH